MHKFLSLIHKFNFLVFIILCCFSIVSAYGGETPSVPGTKVYFINLKEGQTIKSPYVIQIGLTSQMGIAPALADWPDTGHHHIIVDSTITNMNKSISSKHIHVRKRKRV